MTHPGVLCPRSATSMASLGKASMCCDDGPRKRARQPRSNLDLADRARPRPGLERRSKTRPCRSGPRWRCPGSITALSASMTGCTRWASSRCPRWHRWRASFAKPGWHARNRRRSPDRHGGALSIRHPTPAGSETLPTTFSPEGGAARSSNSSTITPATRSPPTSQTAKPPMPRWPCSTKRSPPMASHSDYSPTTAQRSTPHGAGSPADSSLTRLLWELRPSPASLISRPHRARTRGSIRPCSGTSTSSSSPRRSPNCKPRSMHR